VGPQLSTLVTLVIPVFATTVENLDDENVHPSRLGKVKARDSESGLGSDPEKVRVNADFRWRSVAAGEQSGRS
jgi:hypothetical protein